MELELQEIIVENELPLQVVEVVDELDLITIIL
jgi:hypothetical protein